MVITVTVVGPFEEEQEGTGIASDVVKVQGEDPATPGLLPKGIDPGTVTIPQYGANKTKQHQIWVIRPQTFLFSRHRARGILSSHTELYVGPDPYRKGST